MDFGPLGHPKDTCSNHNLNIGGWLRFDRIINKAQRDMWLHRTGERRRDHGIVAHDHRVIDNMLN